MSERRGKGHKLYVLNSAWARLKELSEQTGQSISSIIMWLYSHGVRDFEAEFLKEVKELKAKVSGEKTKGEKIADAYMRDVLFGDVDLKEGKVIGEDDLYGIGSDLDPFVDYRKKKKRIDWQPTGY